MFLGLPFRSGDVDLIRRAILQRHRNGEAAVSYVDRIVDRQLNKARGILTFDSILVASSKIGATADRPVLSLAGLSAIVCLALLWINWGAPRHYESAEAEVTASIALVRRRSFYLAGAIVLALGATVWLLVSTWHGE